MLATVTMIQAVSIVAPIVLRFDAQSYQQGQWEENLSNR